LLIGNGSTLFWFLNARDQNGLAALLLGRYETGNAPVKAAMTPMIRTISVS
jgi:hypothetical protein